jgi:hypothetical protein
METIELVTFRLNAGVETEAFLAAAQAGSQWIRAQPGFRFRSLSEENGLWTDMVYWETRAAAEAAAAAFPTVAEVAPFAGMIDMGTAQIAHSSVRLMTRGG